MPFYDTEVSGFVDDSFLSGQGLTRLVSNFVIYPKSHFAELLVDPTEKIVETSANRIVQGVKHSGNQVRLYYFFGDPHQIYAAYRNVRNESGYKIWMPKYEAFGVGWEAFWGSSVGHEWRNQIKRALTGTPGGIPASLDSDRLGLLALAA